MEIRWEKRPRQELPRCSGGHDWSTERKVLLDVGDGRRIWWWPGSTEWAGIGSSAYRTGTLEVEFLTNWDEVWKGYTSFGKHIRHETMLSGGRLSVSRLNAPDLRAAIAKLLKLRETDLPELDPRATWVAVK